MLPFRRNGFRALSANLRVFNHARALVELNAALDNVREANRIDHSTAFVGYVDPVRHTDGRASSKLMGCQLPSLLSRDGRSRLDARKLQAFPIQRFDSVVQVEVVSRHRWPICQIGGQVELPRFPEGGSNQEFSV